jgi:hypothetical protein
MFSYDIALPEQITRLREHPHGPILSATYRYRDRYVMSWDTITGPTELSLRHAHTYVYYLIARWKSSRYLERCQLTVSTGDWCSGVGLLTWSLWKVMLQFGFVHLIQWTTTEETTRWRECWDRNRPPRPQFVTDYEDDDDDISRCNNTFNCGVVKYETVKRFTLEQKTLTTIFRTFSLLVKNPQLLFWVVTACRLVGRYQRFGETFSLHSSTLQNIGIYLQVYTTSQPRTSSSSPQWELQIA